MAWLRIAAIYLFLKSLWDVFQCTLFIFIPTFSQLLSSTKNSPSPISAAHTLKSVSPSAGAVVLKDHTHKEHCLAHPWKQQGPISGRRGPLCPGLASCTAAVAFASRIQKTLFPPCVPDLWISQSLCLPMVPKLWEEKRTVSEQLNVLKH